MSGYYSNNISADGPVWVECGKQPYGGPDVGQEYWEHCFNETPPGINQVVDIPPSAGYSITGLGITPATEGPTGVSVTGTPAPAATAGTLPAGSLVLVLVALVAGYFILRKGIV